MDTRVQFSVDTDILDAINDTAKRSPKLMNTAVKRLVRARRRKVLRVLRREPPRRNPNERVRWKSDRQRRFVMRKLRRENNLPYQRTGELARSWYMRENVSRGGGVVEIGNDSDAARFVQGDDQQPFHIDTGWTFAPPIIAKEIDDLNDALIETWFTVSDPFAGVR